MANHYMSLLMTTILLCGLSGRLHASFFDNVLDFAEDTVEKVPVVDKVVDVAKPLVDKVIEVGKPVVKQAVQSIQPLVRGARSLPDDVPELKNSTTLDKSRKRCKKGLQKWKSNCYFFSRMKVNWFDALVACKDVLGGRLLEISGRSELKYVTQQIKARAAKGNYWLGASNFRNRNEFRWLSSQQKVRKWLWTRHEPSAAVGWERSLDVSKTDRTNDERCRTKQFFICEVETY